ncbi:MAG: nuclear transport factor 2 family protein [Congregibacter sp.]
MSISAQDKVEILELLSRSAYAYDERKLDMLAACFTEDAQFSILIRDADMMGPFDGREAIMGLYRGALEQQTDVRRHVVSNAFFDRETEDPKIISNLTLFATDSGDTRLLTTGVYSDTVRHEDGVWRLYRRHLDLDGPY